MVFGWFKSTKSQPRPRDVYSGLRTQVLSLKPSDIGVSPTLEMPVVWGLLMETGMAEATFTLVSLADGTTSLYFSNGGGVIGAGEHTPVAQATAGFIAMAQRYHGQLLPTTTFPMPTVGRVRFYLLTFSGVLTAEADEQELVNGRHDLAPLFHKGHEVIGHVRICTERMSKE